MKKEFIILVIFMFVVMGVALRAAANSGEQTPSNHTYDVANTTQTTHIEDVTDDYKEVCVNGLVYYQRKPKSGHSADYALSPKIILPPDIGVDRVKVGGLIGHGLYQRC